MKTGETELIREELLSWIGSMNDSSLLNLLNSIKLSTSKSQNDWWDELTANEKMNIQHGLEDLTSGRTISSEEFWQRLKNE